MTKKQVKKEIHKEIIKTIKYLNFLTELATKKLIKKGKIKHDRKI